MSMKKDLARLSVFAGIRFDLVQAGGGNSSIKIDERQMLIKASGINLSQITDSTGFVIIDYRAIRKDLNCMNFAGLNKLQREKAGESITQKAMLDHEGRASIETFLHALMNTHTLHTHPISVNMVAVQDNWRNIFTRIFPGCLCVGYATPGIDLSIALFEEMQKITNETDSLPEIIFLQNHGLIVSSVSVERVRKLTNEIVVKLEQFLSIDLQPYRDTEHLRSLFARAGYSDVIPFLTEDLQIQKGLSRESQTQGVWAFCPDTLIYCHVHPVFLRDTLDIEPLATYIRTFHDAPKVVVVNKNVYCVGSTLEKAKEIEELLKFHLMVVTQTGTNINRLPMAEVAYLNDWDAEKYRQEI